MYIFRNFYVIYLSKRITFVIYTGTGNATFHNLICYVNTNLGNSNLNL